MPFAQYLRPLGVATSVLAAGLLIASLATGVTQESFEVVAGSADFAKRLLASGAALRLIFAIDFIFIAAYTGFFLAWAADQRDRGADRWALLAGLAAMLAVAVLDLIEDSHILSMLRTSEHGIALSDGAIAWQMLISQIKFLLSYISIALLALTWPARGAFANAVRWLLILQLPFGVAIFTAPDALLPPLYFGRAIFFIVGPLLLLAAMKRER